MIYNDFLKVYDKIIIYCESQKKDLDFIVKCVNEADDIKKVLIVSDSKIDFISNNTNLHFYQINREEKDELLDLYFMYEFSEHITIVNNNPQYPSIFNYLSVGLLTNEDLIKALLQ